MPESDWSAARRSAQAWIEEAVLAGRTNTDIYNTLRTSGFGYREADVRKDANRLREQGTDAAMFRAFDPQARIPVDMIREVEKGNMVIKEAFRADFLCEWHDAVTGKVSYKKFSYSFSTPLSINALANEMREQTHWTPESPKGRIASATLTHIYAKAVEDWEEM